MKTMIALIACMVLTPLAATAQVEGRQMLREQAAAYDASRDMLGQMIRGQAMEEQQNRYREAMNPRRVRRAEEAAALINKGDCAGARDLAVRAHDDRLATRVEQVCAGLAVPVPAPTPAPQ